MKTKKKSNRFSFLIMKTLWKLSEPLLRQAGSRLSVLYSYGQYKCTAVSLGIDKIKKVGMSLQ